MNLPSRLKVLTAGILLAGWTGCSSLAKLHDTRLHVVTSPEAATVVIDGQGAGAGPFHASLAASRPHTIVARKVGSEKAAVVVLPATRQEAQRTLGWGVGVELTEDCGCSPGEITLALRPAYAASARPDAFAELTANLAQADKLQAAGRLSPEEHGFLVRQIAEFYAP